MKNRYKIITLIVIIAVLCAAMCVTTFALSYPSSSDEVDAHKWQALEQIILANDEDPYTICVDTNYGINGTYSLTDDTGATVTTKVHGDTTKKISIEPSLPNEYLATDITLTFRDISCIRDPNDILNFYPFNDIYLCFDEYIAPKVTANLTFTLEGYKLNDDGVYVLTSTPFDFTFTFNVTATQGTVANNSYACRIRIDEGLNRLTGTRSEWNEYMTNSDGFAIGVIRNTKLSITSVGDGVDSLFVGAITTARHKGLNNNNSYVFARLPDIAIPRPGGGYDDGYNSGYTDGFERGQDVGYEDGYVDGLETNSEQAYNSGYNQGKIDGYNEGKTDGYQEGYVEGEDYGYELGVRQGQDWGYEWGYDVGKTDGYNEGLADASQIPHNVGEFLVDSVGSFFDFPLFGEGSITIGGLLLIALTIPLLVWFLKMFAGG